MKPEAGRPAAVVTAALARSFPLFLTYLVDAGGLPLELPAHLVSWAQLIETETRLVLRAPRGHGKSTLVLSHLLWSCWRHGRTPAGWAVDGRAGPFNAVLFSATQAQADELMARLRDLLLANEPLFGPLLEEPDRFAKRRSRWSATGIRLPNGAGILTRAYGTSVRGMHPDLLVLDDVLSDTNSLTSEQRDKTLRYFMRTLMPMRTSQIVVVGTAIHQDDLLARIGRVSATGSQRSPLGFRSVTCRALDEESGEPLWPERFPAARLESFRDADPVAFSCEFQNDPLDDTASLFPHEVTERAIAAGSDLVLGSSYPADASELVVLGVDLARSGGAQADYTVAMVVAWNRATGDRRVLEIRREKGLTFDLQVRLMRELVVLHRVSLGLIEDNGFQLWLIDELNRWPDTRGKIFGHRTGSNKADQREGIPRLAFQFRAGTWRIPSGDRASRALARVFQSELAAFGYRHGKLSGVGAHDDTVVAAWLVERAIALLEEILPTEPDIITIEDLGIQRVKIGPDY